MNNIEDNSAYPVGLIQDHANVAPQSLVGSGPYDRSLVGEYGRMVLLLIAIPLLIQFGYVSTHDRHGMLALLGTAMLLVSLLTDRGSRGLRIVLLVAMGINIFSMIVNPNDLYGKENENSNGIPTIILLISLVSASLFEIAAWIQSSSRATLVKTLAWGTLAIPALIYILGIPLLIAFGDLFVVDEKKLALKDPNWNWWNEATYRAAKFGVFGTFAYLGACLGSFLNVIAASIPKGEAIALRDSKCPQCHEKIKRVDNLPIFSYINLGARCRNCKVSIPSRYLIVEIVGGLIFGSLFLYELVTGCANVPFMNIHHESILWIILYPKWPAIAIYFYHALFMSMILVLAIVESDRQPMRLIHKVLLGLAFFLAAAIYWPIQPVPLMDHLPFSINLPTLVEQILKLTIGGLAGAGIWFIIRKLDTRFDSPSLLLGLSLTGIVLGWQGLIQVTLFFAIFQIAIRFIPKLNQRASGYPTSVLLVAILLHHPFWKIISDCW